jgi:molybdopterin synthase sulfur carrier subunit
MTITVKFFAILRDIAGRSELICDCSPGVTVHGISEMIFERYALMAIHIPKIAYAVNEQFVPLGTELHDGDVLAMIPPVSGG